MRIDAIGPDFRIATISVRGAALIFALDRGTFQGRDFLEDELASFVEDYRVPTHVGDGTIGVWKGIHAILSSKPEGTIKSAHSEILSALINSISNRELATDQLRMNLEECIDPDNTFLDLVTLGDWALEHGLEFGDLWEEYYNAEATLIKQIEDNLADRRTNQRSATWLDSTPGLSDLPHSLQALYTTLHEENRRLREESRQVTYPESRRRHDNLLKLVAVMAMESYGERLSNPYKLAGSLEAAAQRVGISLGDDTIAKRLKEAISFLPMHGGKS